jgi:malonyl-CoA O-methyltransferase
VLELPGESQWRCGAVPGEPGARWVSAAGLAHLAVVWYRLAERDRADRAMRWLAGWRGRTGVACGSRRRVARHHAGSEAAWVAKHYLDAALLQVQAAFEARWNELPDSIDPMDGRFQAVRLWLDGFQRGASVADVGCGKGRFLQHLAVCFPEVRLTGIDFSPAMLSLLPERVAALQGSLLQIPAADAAFDGTFAVESLEHSLIPKQAVSELCRIVRPGGRVLIIDKHSAKQPLSEHEPWERWFSGGELSRWLARYCDEVTVEPIVHGTAPVRSGLFLAAAGRRR